MTAERTRTTQPAEAPALGSALRTIATERDGLEALRAALGDALAGPFCEAVSLIQGVAGRVIVTGMGKSGHVGQKLAATLASTGTPAFFVHPSEASHGDLGMIRPEDAVIALSWSGETVELRAIVEYSRRFRVPLVAITSRAMSALARAADVVLALPQAPEACPHGLAPTTSTVMQLALGDALAVALLEARGFSARDFSLLHPGGRLGAMLQHVADVMHRGDAVPLAPSHAPMSEVLVVMTRKSFGCIGLTDADGALVGIVTDGDLRRHMRGDLLAKTASEIMTRAPRTVTPDLLASQALQILNAQKITALFVVEGRRPVGILHLHDLLRVGAA